MGIYGNTAFTLACSHGHHGIATFFRDRLISLGQSAEHVDWQIAAAQRLEVQKASLPTIAKTQLKTEKKSKIVKISKGRHAKSIGNVVSESQGLCLVEKHTDGEIIFVKKSDLAQNSCPLQ